MILVTAFAIIFTTCATTGSGSNLSLLDAIEQSADKIANELPADSRVAIVAFESASPGISDYIMEELTGALVDRGIEVADRRNLPYLLQEFNFQMSGMVSDETAVSVGKIIGANMVITGQLIDLNGTYRYRTSAIRMEQATRASVTRLNVRDSAETRRIIAALAQQQTVVIATKYGVSEDKTPQTAGTFLDRGIMFAMRGEYDMAILDFTDAIEKNPNMAAAYMLRARALVASVSEVVKVDENFGGLTTANTKGLISPEKARIYNLAIEDLTQAIRLDPDNANAYNHRGHVYTNKGDYDRAIADYTQAIRLDPDNVKVYSNRGIAYSDKGDYDQAIADYTQAIRLDPDYFVAYFNRGNRYIDKSDYDRAIADFTQAIRLGLNFFYVYYYRGNAYYNKGDYDRAIADYTEAISLDSNYADAYYHRGKAYTNKGDYTLAIADYEAFLRLDPHYLYEGGILASPYFIRGNMYYDIGDYDRAIVDYTGAIRLDSNYAMAYRNRGLAYYFKKDYDRAISDYTEVIRLDPAYIADVYNNRGLAYFNNGDYTQAIADYEEALRIDQNHTNAKENLEIARQRQQEITPRVIQAELIPLKPLPQVKRVEFVPLIPASE